MKTALVTGSAGFIGYHVAARLLGEGWRVVGLDCMNNYYDVALKQARHGRLAQSSAFTPIIAKLEERDGLKALFAKYRPEIVIHLAAQAGVRHSIDEPRVYVESNLLGQFELLEAARTYPPAHLLAASTSSVYGANSDMPYGERDKADTQMSFYAATKKAGEAMAHSYAHLYGIPTTMFRFFTVYGPWGRPDMALFKFTHAILRGEIIDVYNHGEMKRDFTYIDDLVDGVFDLISVVPGSARASRHDSLSHVAPFRVVNIGASAPLSLMEFIAAIETETGVRAQKRMMNMQPGDVPSTWAETGLIHDLTGYTPKVHIKDGIARFVEWYRAYYRI